MSPRIISSIILYFYHQFKTFYLSKEVHILVIRFSAMGDVAMTVPVIKALVAHYPEVKITVVSKPFLKPLFKNIHNVSFYPLDVTGRHKGILGLYRLYKELQAVHSTHIADLHNVLRSKIIRLFFKFSKKPIATIDKGRAEKKALTRKHNKVFKQLKSSHLRYADVFKKLGFAVDISTPLHFEKPVLLPQVLKITDTKNHNWIGIAPFAAFDSKIYPLYLMEEVIEKLSQNHTVFLFGGKQKEAEILTEIALKNSSIISIAGKLNLEEELNLIANLECMLAMDSGNAHFAAMLHIPTITLWGATHPYAGFAPFHQPKENCILPDLKKYPNIPCSIYGNKIGEGYTDVMKTIPPSAVLKRIEDLLKFKFNRENVPLKKLP